MDWGKRELVEVSPGKVSGAPLVVGTRIPADVIVRNYEAGSSTEEIEENYPALDTETQSRDFFRLVAFQRSRSK